MRTRSLRFTPSFDQLPSRLTPSGTTALVPTMNAVMLGPAVPPPTDCLAPTMSAVMLGPAKEPTDVLVEPPMPEGLDLSPPTNILASDANPNMLAVNSGTPTCDPTALAAPVLAQTVTADPTLSCPTLMYYA